MNIRRHGFGRTQDKEDRYFYRRCLCTCGHAERSHEYTGPYEQVCRTCRQRGNPEAHHVFYSRGNAELEAEEDAES